MNALKELLEKKRQAAQGQQLGDRKYAKQADLEEQRLKRVREEELQEREEKVWGSDPLQEATLSCHPHPMIFPVDPEKHICWKRSCTACAGCWFKFCAALHPPCLCKHAACDMICAVLKTHMTWRRSEGSAQRAAQEQQCCSAMRVPPLKRRTCRARRSSVACACWASPSRCSARCAVTCRFIPAPYAKLNLRFSMLASWNALLHAEWLMLVHTGVRVL